VCRLAPQEAIPSWSESSDFFSVTRSSDELSIVCCQHLVPQEIGCSRNWRLLRIDGDLDLRLIGVLSGLLAPLARADVSVFVLSTFNTDYFMVPAQVLEKAAEVLKEEGHRVMGEV
jgi:hypothetical protein